jgi:hypothetical protein
LDVLTNSAAFPGPGESKQVDRGYKIDINEHMHNKRRPIGIPAISGIAEIYSRYYSAQRFQLWFSKVDEYKRNRLNEYAPLFPFVS